jgi:hypothetical protein
MLKTADFGIFGGKLASGKGTVALRGVENSKGLMGVNCTSA